MVAGFIPGSVRAGEFGREGVPELDISAVVFLIDQPKVEEEICSEDVSCYTGSLRPFKDLLVFPEDVNFSGLVELLERHEVVLVDVRQPKELLTDGEIPAAFQMSSQDFKAKYGFNLPEKDATNVVLTCRSGRRILVAQERLKALGFSDLRLYRGSINDWKANDGPLV